MPTNPFSDYDPYAVLEELANQNKDLAKNMAVLVNNQRALAEEFNDQHSKIMRLRLVINNLRAQISSLRGRP